MCVFEGNIELFKEFNVNVCVNLSLISDYKDGEGDIHSTSFRVLTSRWSLSFYIELFKWCSDSGSR